MQEGDYEKNGYRVWTGVAVSVRKKPEGAAPGGGKKNGLVYIGETFAHKKHGESIFVPGEEIKELTGEQLKKAYKGL